MDWPKYVRDNYLQPLFTDDEYTNFITLKPEEKNDIDEINTFLDNAIKFILKRGLLFQILDLAVEKIKDEDTEINTQEIKQKIKQEIIEKPRISEKEINDELFKGENENLINFIDQILSNYDINYLKELRENNKKSNNHINENL